MKILTLGLFLLALPLVAAPRYVTLSKEGDSLSVNSGETIELVSYSDLAPYIQLPGHTGYSGYWTNRTGPSVPFVISGPVKLRVYSFAPLYLGSDVNVSSYATFRILPDVADPNATLILPPSTNQVTVHLQSSSNLVDWSSVASVTFTNVPAALFFRAKLAE